MKLFINLLITCTFMSTIYGQKLVTVSKYQKCFKLSFTTKIEIRYWYYFPHDLIENINKLFHFLHNSSNVVKYRKILIFNVMVLTSKRPSGIIY